VTTRLPADAAGTQNAAGSAELPVTIVVTAAGTVPGPGGTVAVPTLGQWGLMLMGLLAAGLGMRRLRRRQAQP
jgi:hypothetical protein